MIELVWLGMSSGSCVEKLEWLNWWRLDLESLWSGKSAGSWVGFGFGMRGSLVEVVVGTSGTCAQAVVDWDLGGLD